jgi:broad specificity phosphatase PhoE
MTQVVLIKAGPTPWDAEERIAGNVSLPLTDEARERIAHLLDTLPPVDAVYRCQSNESCDQVAKMMATLRKLKPRDVPELGAWCLGLWQGLRLEDLRQRYPTALEQWEQSPATIVPPEGEPFTDAIDRLAGAAGKIVRRNRGKSIAIVVRPTTLQILIGVLRRETPEQIASHLQNDSTMETIGLSDEDVKAI